MRRALLPSSGRTQDGPQAGWRGDPVQAAGRAAKKVGVTKMGWERAGVTVRKGAQEQARSRVPRSSLPGHLFPSAHLPCPVPAATGTRATVGGPS